MTINGNFRYEKRVFYDKIYKIYSRFAKSDILNAMENLNAKVNSDNAFQDDK